MEALWQDVRYGIRMLWQSPGFTIVALLALTLGIGANSAIFSVVNSVLLRPLSYEESENLVILSERSQVLEGMSISYPNFTDWRDQNQVFEHIAVYRRQSYNLTGAGDPEYLLGAMVSHSLFPALRVEPLMGRTFTEEEDKPGGDQVVVLTYGLWQRRFGSDPNILGQTLTLNSKPYAVIGVMPSGFLFPSRAELWVPVGQESGQQAWLERGNHPGLYGVARFKQGVMLDQARADMDTIAIRLEQQYPQSNTGNRVSITPMLEQSVSNIRPALLVLMGAVAFVLLIACANVANLLLARAAARQKEFAIRSALGAGRVRLVRQLLTESAMLSIAGGALGLLLAVWGVKLIIGINPDGIPRAREISLDARVVFFTFAVSFVTGIVFGLVPAWYASKPDMNETLKDAGRGSTGGIHRQRFRNVLVVTEVALALVLLIGGGLMIRSFYTLQQVHPGFEVSNLLTFQFTLPRDKYAEQPQRVNFYRQVTDRIEVMPGVESVGLATGLPLGNNGNQTSFTVECQPEPEPGQRPLAEVVYVSPEYFKTMQMPLLKGRTFNEQDTADSPRVFVIDETFASRHWPGEDPIGKQVRFGGTSNPPSTVVGLVKRVKMEGLDTDSNRVQAYFPYTQSAWTFMNVVVRTAGDAESMTSSLRQQVLSIDKDQPIYNIRTMQNIREQVTAPQRLNVLLLGIFAAVALILAAVGIYGVMSYAVTQRTHEMGIRLALGARPADVLKLVVGQGMKVASIGILIGLIGAFGLTRLMSSLLFGVSATDPVTFVAIALLLTLIALMANFIPARRATRVSPIIALRYE